MNTAPHRASAISLAALAERHEATIATNSDRKSREMGLAPGAHVRMLRNRRDDHAVVIALGDARFMVSRAIAEGVAVAPAAGGTAG